MNCHLLEKPYSESGGTEPKDLGDAATVPLVTSQHTPLFSLLPLEGGAPKGRRLALEAIFSLAGMPTPPRFARLPLPEEVARMILNRASPFI